MSASAQIKQAQQYAAMLKNITKPKNDEIKALKIENQRLRQEVEALRANNEIDPRKEESLYKLIIGMAIDGYRHNPAGNSSTVKELEGVLTRLGIPLGERTIRNHLNTAKSYLPPKPIDT